jgi:hypothetical protein
MATEKNCDCGCSCRHDRGNNHNISNCCQCSTYGGGGGFGWGFGPGSALGFGGLYYGGPYAYAGDCTMRRRWVVNRYGQRVGRWVRVCY